jgi:hypothetical protein
MGITGANDIVNPNGLPTASTCGPTTNQYQAAYVVFTTTQALTGAAANFAMHGDAWVLDQGTISASGNSVASVPVIPLADGDDNNALQGLDGPPLNNFALGVTNEVVLTSGPDIFNVAPIAAGIRMNDADGNINERVLLQNDLRGPASGSEQSMHVYWFDRNNPSRSVQGWVYDDQQASCSHGPQLPYELNILLYNNRTQVPAGSNPVGWAGWNGFTAKSANGFYTDLISAIANRPFTGGYSSPIYCQPAFWNIGVLPGYLGSLNGYVYLTIREEGNQVPGFVDAAAIAFNWQDSLPIDNTPAVASGWSSHLTEALGISVPGMTVGPLP